MTDIVKGMIAAQRTHAIDGLREGALVTGESKQRAALLWFADNVSDEMVLAYLHCPKVWGTDVRMNISVSISAAIRAAAGGNSD
jgi:hypothetical protein